MFLVSKNGFLVLVFIKVGVLLWTCVERKEPLGTSFKTPIQKLILCPWKFFGK